MVISSMIRRSALGLALVLVASGTIPARADDVVAPDGSLIRRTKLERSCGDALARFCPELSSTPGQTRNQVICLRPYRLNLPPYCRAAVNAALK